MKLPLDNELNGGPQATPPRRKILVVDDEFLIAHDIAEAIAEFGCEAIGPVSGLEEALGLIRDRSPDAAIIDLNLGTGEEGAALAELLVRRQCPFVVLSGDDAACERVLDRYPGVLVVRKPAPRHELRRALDQLSHLTR